MGRRSLIAFFTVCLAGGLAACSPTRVTEATVASSAGSSATGDTGSDGSAASSTSASTDVGSTGGGTTGDSAGTTGTTGGAGGACSPCLLDTDCGEAGIASCIIEDAADATGYCAPACSDASDCDPGSLCFPTDGSFQVCYPASGSCDPAEGTSTSTGTTGGDTTSTSTSGTSGSTGSSEICGSKVGPDEPGPCTCPAGKTCGLNGCYSGWWCDTTAKRCGPPPTSGCVFGTASSSSGTHSSSSSASSSSSGTTGGHSSSSSGTTGTHGTSGSTGAVGPAGGTVDLMHFAVSGDTRPPACGDTTNYPTAIIDSIADSYAAAGAQFALDLGDHMYVCNNSLTVATTQMNLFMQATRRYAGQWFMTMGNHECMGGSSNSSCLAGSTNSNFTAYMSALAPISSTPYYKVEVHTRLGLVIFVFIADNSWDSVQSSWLSQTLTDADSRATYTIIAKHHPQGDTSVAANTTIMQLVRAHKFALLLTGHTHSYTHQTTDQARDIVLGNGGAPLVSAGTFNGYAVVDQLASGRLQVTVYDVSTHAQMDQWSVGPN